MSDQNYNKSIQVSAGPKDAFNVVTRDFGRWWTRPDWPLDHVGDRAKFSFSPGISHWTFELTRADSPFIVEWTCVDALHIHKGQQKEIEKESLGTKVNRTIASSDEGARIEIEHAGLTPDLHCYGICEAGWDQFFLGGLNDYLKTGTGAPHRGK